MKQKHILFYVLFAMFANVTTTANAQAVNVQDSLALVDLYNSTDGPNWNDHTNWLTGPVSTWYGVTVTGKRVTKIEMTYNNLSGAIPASIGNLTGLTWLNLYANQLSGAIPSELGNLTSLTSLNLSWNQLNGSTIPPSLGNLTNLVELSLGGNHLTGGIPASLGNLIKLNLLSLFYNELNDTIPASLGNLSNLNNLYLNDNQLTGSIPSSFGNLINLSSLYVYSNKLSGSIPSSLGNLIHLQDLRLRDNRLTGRIPAAFGNLANLHYLMLGYNQLSGTIPTSLGNAPNLSYIDLSYNNLTGTIPASLGNLPLGNLVLSNNQLSGNIPASLGNIINLGTLVLSNNQLTGSVPSSFSNLVNLNGLLLDNNKLKGHITNAIGNFKQLYELNLSHNEFNGDISPAIASLASYNLTQVLDLSYNQFKFNGMELVAQTYPFAYYNDQSQVKIHKTANTLSVSAGGTLTNNTYEWFKVGKTGSTTVTGDSVFHPTENGIYYANVTNSIATQLTLKSDTVRYIAAGLLDDFSSVDQSQAASKENVFTVYPNPVKDILHIQTAGKATVTLTDQSGKTIFTKIINGKEDININHLPAGFYYLKNDETGASQKVVIVK